MGKAASLRLAESAIDVAGGLFQTEEVCARTGNLQQRPEPRVAPQAETAPSALRACLKRCGALRGLAERCGERHAREVGAQMSPVTKLACFAGVFRLLRQSDVRWQSNEQRTQPKNDGNATWEEDGWLE